MKESCVLIEVGNRKFAYRFVGVPEDLEWQISRLIHAVFKEELINAQAVVRDFATFKEATFAHARPQELVAIMDEVQRCSSGGEG